jgi:ribonuclease P protein component
MRLERGQFHEKNLSAKQYSQEKNARFHGEDEHPRGKECFEAEENEGQKKIERLNSISLTPGNRGSIKKTFCFAKKERIVEPQDFKKVMRFGKKLSSRNLVVFMKRNESLFHRLGIVVSKEVGSAVYRNRVKRILREYFRLHKCEVAGSFDMIILVKRGCSIKRFGDAERELRRLLAGC